jgi:hypothetical protein
MKCLRCGYCCLNLCVVIVDDPKKGVRKGNLKWRDGKSRCQHLKGDKPGEYSCGVHDRKWYKKTPCFSHGQFEKNPNAVCRIGEYILKGKK